MEILSLCFYMILQTTLIGTTSYVIWRIICLVAGDRIMKYRYGFLKLQLVFWLVPIGMILNYEDYHVYRDGVVFGTWLENPLGPSMISRTIVLIWIIGCLCKFGIRCYEQWRFIALMKGNHYAEEAIEIKMVELCEELDLPFADIDVSVNERVSSPFVYSKRGTHIVLPAFDYTEQELEIILRHELFHVKKRDLVFKRIIAAVNIFQWFNPFAMTYKKELFLWSEVDCDLDVCATGISTKEYCALLLRTCELKDALPEEIAFFLRSKPEISKRIENMDRSRNCKTMKKMTAVMLGVVFAMLATSNAYAAGDVIEDARTDISQIGWSAESEIMNEGDDVLVEYEEPFSTVGLTVIDMDLEAVVYGDGYYSGVWTMPADSYASKSLGTLADGDKVNVMVRAELGMKVGLSYNTTKRYFLTGDDVSMHEFTVNYNGTHRIFVENTLDHEVEVTIMVMY